MEEAKIRRWLEALGKRTFVLCFEMFMSNYQATHYSKIAELIPVYDTDAINNDPVNTLPRKASYAIDLFNKKAEIQALKICSTSKKLNTEIRKMAKDLLLKYGTDSGMTAVETLNYQDEIEKFNQKIVNIEKIKNTPPIKILQKHSETYKRNPEIAYVAKVLSDFKCEIDNNHKTFIAETSEKQYMEAHHIVPMMYQDDFEYSLDCVTNIISVCPNCHRALHNAGFELKKKMLTPLFETRKNCLYKSNVQLSLDKLLQMYQ